MIKSLTPKNFLSFGPDNPGIELGPLNVLIGPNGCGKSNLIEAVNFMRAAPRELRDVTRQGGGTAEWIWKGNAKEPASVECEVPNPDSQLGLRHLLQFRSSEQRFSLVDERIDQVRLFAKVPDAYPLYHFQRGHPVLYASPGDPRRLPASTVEPDRSILAQFRDPVAYPEFASLSDRYQKVRIYREGTFGPNNPLREHQRADGRLDRIEEDFSNLGIFLNRLQSHFPAAKRSILEGLQDLYADITDFVVSIRESTVQVRLIEAGDFSISAARLSDGTLGYLCLLAILCDPEPPPLICIEEPELGLHPDILPTLADKLREVSNRVQLIVTTHSDILVDALTETPESVIVCSKHEGKTSMERLKPDALARWLDKYRLGELWMSGELGGTRW